MNQGRVDPALRLRDGSVMMNLISLWFSSIKKGFARGNYPLSQNVGTNEIVLYLVSADLDF